MLKFYVKRSVGEEYILTANPPEENAWIHGDEVEEEELKLLANTYQLDWPTLRDVLDRDELPRIELKNGALYVFIRIASRNKHGVVETVPLLLAAKDSVFLNAAAIPVTDHKVSHPNNFALPTHDTGGLLLATIAAVVTEYEDLIRQAGHYIHDIGARLRTHEVTNKDFIRFVTMEDNLSEYEVNLSGMMVIMDRLKEVLNSDQDKESIEDVKLYLRQLRVMLQSHGQSIASIRNAYGIIANNTLNQRMKTLTVLTFMMAVPNVFYGMYGMNVGLPFQESSWAYYGIVIFTIILVVTTFIVARKRRLL